MPTSKYTSFQIKNTGTAYMFVSLKDPDGNTYIVGPLAPEEESMQVAPVGTTWSIRFEQEKGGSDATKGGLEAVKGGSDATKGGSDATKGGSDATKGGSDATKGGSDATKGGSDATKGGSDATKGGSDAIN